MVGNPGHSGSNIPVCGHEGFDQKSEDLGTRSNQPVESASSPRKQRQETANLTKRNKPTQKRQRGSACVFPKNDGPRRGRNVYAGHIPANKNWKYFATMHDREASAIIKNAYCAKVTSLVNRPPV